MSGVQTTEKNAKIPTAESGHGQGGAGDFSSLEQENTPNQFGWSFPLCTVTGITIRAHSLLPLVMIFSACVGAGKDGGSGFGAELLLYGPILFCAVLVHELCHCWAARKCGGSAEQILLWPLGGLAFIGNLDSASKDLKVAVAGPLSHIPQIFLFMILTAIVNSGKVTADSVPGKPSNGFWAFLFYHAMMIHVSLFAFNLFLPCYPLDGGRVLADALLMARFSAEKAAKIVVAISVPIGVVLLVIGFLLLTEGNGAAVLTIVVALWLCWQIKALWVMISSDTVSQHPLFANAKEWEAAAPPAPVQGPVDPIAHSGTDAAVAAV